MLNFFYKNNEKLLRFIIRKLGMRCPFLQNTWFGEKTPILRNADLYKFWPCSIKLQHFQNVLVWERTIKFSDCPPVLSYSTNLRCCHICYCFISCFRAISGHFMPWGITRKVLTSYFHRVKPWGLTRKV